MVQILPANEKRPSFLQSILGGFAQGLPEAVKQHQQQNAQQAETAKLSELLGLDLSGLSQENIQPFVKEFAAGLRPQNNGMEKEFLKAQQSLVGLQGAQDVLNRMKTIRSKGKIGFGSSLTGLVNPEVRRDSGEYSQLGKSLIQYATNIPIRNRLEFETLAEDLYDPTISDDRAAGILDSMERILSNAIREQQSSLGINNIETSNEQAPKKERKPLASFAR